MIRVGYLSRERRADLIALARDGYGHASALVMPDDGWKYEWVVPLARLENSGDASQLF